MGGTLVGTWHWINLKINMIVCIGKDYSLFQPCVSHRDTINKCYLQGLVTFPSLDPTGGHGVIVRGGRETDFELLKQQSSLPTRG